MMRTVLLLLCAISATQARSIDAGITCRVSIAYRKGDLQEPQPLILTDTELPAFVLPNKSRLLVIPANASILLGCPGKRNALEKHGSKQLVRAICLKGKQFLVDSELYEFNAFKCKLLPRETVKETGSACLQGHYQKYAIGFTVGKHYLPLIELCRDDATYTTLYSKSHLAKEIVGYQSGYPRVAWKYGSYYPGYDLRTIYKFDSQLRSVARLVGSEELALKYLRSEDHQFINRGHLTAKADFIYGAHQMTTLWLLNAAPQWASFNSGNWMILESRLRNFAAAREIDLTVYTGTHGITSLADLNGVQQSFYLHANETHKAFPVPRFFWKVVHEPISNRATAFVGLNEPYARNATKDMYLCTDIGDDPAFSWLDWQSSSIERGLSYVCSVEELRKLVPTIPQLGEIGVLV